MSKRSKKQRTLNRRRRKLLKAGAIALAAAAMSPLVITPRVAYANESAPSIVPRAVHCEAPKRVVQQQHPFFDVVINHSSRNIKIDRRQDGRWLKSVADWDNRQWLEAWITHTVRNPNTQLPGLVLVGPECSGKSTLHEALSLLVPAETIAFHLRLDGTPKYTRLCIQEETDDASAEYLAHVAQQHPGRRLYLPHARVLYVSSRPTALSETESFREISFDQLKRPIPKRDLLRRLQDEQDAYLRRLTNLDWGHVT